MPNFKPNPNGMKPSGFKMKGWGGYQKPSPMQEGPASGSSTKTAKTGKKSWSEVKQDFREAGKQIKEDFGKDGKVYKEIKADIKKLRSKLGFKEKEEERTDTLTKEITDQSDRSPEGTVSTVPQDPGDLEKVDDEIPNVEGFVPGTGDDPWEYKKIDGGYQTRKGPNGDIINVTDPTSDAYRKIGEKIFDVEQELTKIDGLTYDAEGNLMQDIPYDFDHAVESGNLYMEDAQGNVIQNNTSYVKSKNYKKGIENMKKAYGY